MSELFLYQCSHCHVVLAEPNIPPGADYGYGPDIIEAWCPVCDTWREMSLVHIF